MSRTLNVRRSLALAAALALTAAGGAAVPAAADNGNGNGNGQHQAGDKPGKSDESDKGPKGNKGDKGPKGNKGEKGPKSSNGNGPKGNNGNGQGPKENNGNGPKGNNGHGPKNDNGNGPKGNNGNGPKNGGGNHGGDPAGDPPGNNGTVKITPVGQDDGIPQNNPHVVCGFDIEWYGFDEGDDIISEVSLVPHAPTSDVTMTPGGPSEVFVGGDPASGAGTDSGFDGEATYYPTFEGEPHPQQGYHVKLTVHTPGSQGADTKHKVFWIEPCEEAPAVEDETEEETEEETTTPEEEVEGTQQETECTETMGTDEEECEQEVLGIQESASSDSEVAGDQAAQGSDPQDVPSAVDAGEEGNPVLDVVTSPMWLLLLGCGLALGGAVVLARRGSQH